MRHVWVVAGLVALLTGCSGSKPKAMDEPSPATFRVNLLTSRGPVVVEVTKADAPLGADRFYTLVRNKYFDGARFFRVVPGFVVQFGIAADPNLTKTWDVKLKDDPVKGTNARGTISFATSGADTRSTQLFINLGDNQRLDAQGFSPFGKVVSGMQAVDQIYSAYGDQPQQPRIEQEGNAYLEKDFPNLDYIKTARIAE